MKIIFFGLGSIGLRHARILKKFKNLRLYSYRTFKGQIQNNLGIEEVKDFRAIKKIKPDVAFITNPTSLHLPTAIDCAKLKINLFIEKPLGHKTQDINKLLRIVSLNDLTTYVAYVLRFHPVIKALKTYMKTLNFFHMRMMATSYLPDWRPQIDHLKSYSAHQKMGGGVINDLSHELDLAQFILGPIKKIKGRFDRRSQVTIDTEDYADIFVETKSGPANIHINFLSQMEQRLIQMDFKEKSIVGDVLHSTVTEYKHGQPVKRIQFKEGYAECYQEQLRYFFRNIKNPRLMNNVFEASQLTRKIQELKGKK